jgi:hypothetical protein
MKTELIVCGEGGWYYLVPLASGGYQLASDPYGRRILANGYVYATRADAERAAYSFATP